jgi:hypothetical protein
MNTQFTNRNQGYKNNGSGAITNISESSKKITAIAPLKLQRKRPGSNNKVAKKMKPKSAPLGSGDRMWQDLRSEYSQAVVRDSNDIKDRTSGAKAAITRHDAREEATQFAKNARATTTVRTHGLKYVHRACGHEVDFVKMMQTTRITSDVNNIMQSGNSQTMLVVEPRWCPECAKARASCIRRAYAESSTNELPWRAPDAVHHVRKEISRKDGICQGRVDALVLPLTDSAGPEYQHAYIQSMLEMFADIGVVSKHEKMREEGLSGLQVEIQRFSELQKAYEEGILEGRADQAKREKYALELEDYVEKNDMLEMCGY